MSNQVELMEAGNITWFEIYTQQNTYIYIEKR